MNEASSQKLLDDFPRLFRDRHTSSLGNGFLCGDGWFDLIYQLAQDIESVAREHGLRPDSAQWPRCRQVKEKLGSLRFVVFGVDGQAEMSERISELRHAALNRSFELCQGCGQPRQGVVATDDLKIQLWLDDLRSPPDGWIWAKTALEAIAILQKKNVGQMSLDHDLGEEAGVGCGNDVVVWLEKEVGEGRWPGSIPQMTVHSANPVGRARMLQAIASINRFRLPILPCRPSRHAIPCRSAGNTSIDAVRCSSLEITT